MNLTFVTDGTDVTHCLTIRAHTSTRTHTDVHTRAHIYYTQAHTL